MGKVDPVIECIAAALGYGERVWAQHVKRAPTIEDARYLVQARRKEAARIKRALMRKGLLATIPGIAKQSEPR